MGPLLIEAFRYHKWANAHLLGVCAGLNKDQLQLGAAGTYGTIQATLMHLVGAEQRYVRRLAGPEPLFNEDDQFPGVEALRTIADQSADRLIEAAGRITGDDVVEARFQAGRFRMHLGVVLIQALHHGNDHRTHICTILGQHGIDYGDMDVWAYGEATGAQVPISANA